MCVGGVHGKAILMTRLFFSLVICASFISCGFSWNEAVSTCGSAMLWSFRSSRLSAVCVYRVHNLISCCRCKRVNATSCGIVIAHHSYWFISNIALLHSRLFDCSIFSYREGDTLNEHLDEQESQLRQIHKNVCVVLLGRHTAWH